MVWFWGSFEVRFQAPPSRTGESPGATLTDGRHPRASERVAVLVVFDAIDYFSGDLVVGEGSSEFRTLRLGTVASSVISFVVAWVYGLIFGKLRGEIAAPGLPGGTALPVVASSGCIVDYL